MLGNGFGWVCLFAIALMPEASAWSVGSHRQRSNSQTSLGETFSSTQATLSHFRRIFWRHRQRKDENNGAAMKDELAQGLRGQVKEKEGVNGSGLGRGHRRGRRRGRHIGRWPPCRRQPQSAHGDCGSGEKGKGEEEKKTSINFITGVHALMDSMRRGTMKKSMNSKS